MGTVFDPGDREASLLGIQKLTGHEKALWERMDLFQMLRHNTYWNRWILGGEEQRYKQQGLGKVFARFALGRMLRDDRPLDGNLPTSGSLG